MSKNSYFPTMGMSPEEVKEYYINRGREKFGDKFSYTELPTITTQKDLFTLECVIHGEFKINFQRHLHSPLGCLDCGKQQGRDNKRMSFNEFLRRLDEVLPNRNFKILSREFKGRQIKNEKIYTQDEFGICKVRVTVLLEGVSPNIKTALFPNLYNINRYKKLNKFNHLDFSNTKYEGALKYTTVKCRKHVEFPTKPNWILTGYGCPLCAEDNRGDHLRSNIKEFKKKANIVHKEGTYDYSKAVYLSALKKLEIGCNVDGHGTFWQKPNGHLGGEGCPICGKENGGYSKSDYIKQAKGREGVVYIIELKNEDECFYKIGITFQGVKTRFSRKDALPYNYRILYEYKCDAGCTWDLEKELHKKYKALQYYPTIRFAGYTECFNLSLPISEIITNLKTLT